MNQHVVVLVYTTLPLTKLDCTALLISPDVLLIKLVNQQMLSSSVLSQS